MRDDFIEIMQYCDSIGMGTMMATNGWFITEEKAKLIATAHPSLIRVSIDGATAEMHDEIRQKKGSFSQAWEAIDHLRNAGITTGISFTVMEENWSEVIPIIDLAIEKGLEELQVVQLCGAGRGAAVKPMEYEHFSILQKSLAERIEAYRSKITFSATEGLVIKQATERFQSHGEMPQTMGCAGARTCMAIDAEGNVTTCILWRALAGNLREQSLSDIWNSSPLFIKKRTIHKSCEGCEYSDICAGECPHEFKPETEKTRESFVQSGKNKSCTEPSSCITSLKIIG